MIALDLDERAEDGLGVYLADFIVSVTAFGTKSERVRRADPGRAERTDRLLRREDKAEAGL